MARSRSGNVPLGIPDNGLVRPRLILFDIDGTLIRDDGAAREAYADALREIYGHEQLLHGYDFSGKTDPQITYWVLGDAGLERSQIDERLEEFWDCFLEGLAARVSRERVLLLDGVVSLLERLGSDSRFVVGLLTGNIEPGAKLKLAPHGLASRFAFGAFGSDHEDRAALPPVAVERARAHCGITFEGRDVVIVGDSIWDVRCGVPHDATTIAVATGRTPSEVLRAENPDHLFESLEPSESLLAALAGDTPSR